MLRTLPRLLLLRNLLAPLWSTTAASSLSRDVVVVVVVVVVGRRRGSAFGDGGGCRTDRVREKQRAGP